MAKRKIETSNLSKIYFQVTQTQLRVVNLSLIGKGQWLGNRCIQLTVYNLIIYVTKNSCREKSRPKNAFGCFCDATANYKTVVTF